MKRVLASLEANYRPSKRTRTGQGRGNKRRNVVTYMVVACALQRKSLTRPFCAHRSVKIPSTRFFQTKLSPPALIPERTYRLSYRRRFPKNSEGFLLKIEAVPGKAVGSRLGFLFSLERARGRSRKRTRCNARGMAGVTRVVREASLSAFSLRACDAAAEADGRGQKEGGIEPRGSASLLLAYETKQLFRTANATSSVSAQTNIKSASQT